MPNVISFTIFVCCLLLGFCEGSRDIRARYPVTFYQPDYVENLNVDFITAKTPSPFNHKTQDYQVREGTVRRRPQSSRYQNIFGNSQIIHGSEFVPKELSPYVGRLYDNRREIFSWSPSSNILESRLANY